VQVLVGEPLDLGLEGGAVDALGRSPNRGQRIGHRARIVHRVEKTTFPVRRVADDQRNALLGGGVERPLRPGYAGQEKDQAEKDNPPQGPSLEQRRMYVPILGARAGRASAAPHDAAGTIHRLPEPI